MKLSRKKQSRSDLPEHSAGIALIPQETSGSLRPAAEMIGSVDIEAIVRATVDAVLTAIKRK